MKKLIKSVLTAGILVCAIFFGGTAGIIPGNVMSVYAAQVPQENKISVSVKVNGQPVEFGEEPRLIGGSVMVPVKEIGEALGWEVRMKSEKVFEFAQASLYTDGSRKYLFSSHTITFNLERGWFNRSIMIGVGHFLDTEDDHNINFKLTPIVVNGVIYVGVRDLAVSLYAAVEWDSDTKTVSITSRTIPYYDGQGLPNRDELFEEMRKYNKVSETLTKLNDQSQIDPVKSIEPEKPKITSLFQPAGVMKSAPESGSFPAKILLPGKKDVDKADSYYEAYKYSVGHGCNWYAFGRFYETYGYRISVPYTGGFTYLDAVDKANKASVITERDLKKIISGCVAVYWRKNVGGHVVFVEYVERDDDGNPVNVYYTECMNSNGSGVYKPKSDAKVKKVTFERFKKSSSGEKDLMGYVVPIQ